MKAKDMFEESNCIYDEDELGIAIYKETKALTKNYICIFYKTDNERFRLKLYETYIDMRILKAINKQVEELGWNNEK